MKRWCNTRHEYVASDRTNLINVINYEPQNESILYGTQVIYFYFLYFCSEAAFYDLYVSPELSYAHNLVD